MSNIFKKRRAIRVFRNDNITPEQIEKIISAAMYAPSGYDRHPLNFIVVRNERMKYKLAKTNQWTSYADKSNVIIVICADPNKSDVWLEDASIAAGYMWLKCAEIGAGACWNHVRDSKRPNGESGESYVKNLLKIPDNQKVICLLILGYSAIDLPEHKAEEYIKERIHYETWGIADY